MYELYKIVRPLGPISFTSFEVTDKYAHTYGLSRFNTTPSPSFFFLSRSAARKYYSCYDLFSDEHIEAELWHCFARTISAVPKMIPASDNTSLFSSFWRCYYSNPNARVEDAFTGLVKPPFGTVLSFNFIFESRIDIDTRKGA